MSTKKTEWERSQKNYYDKLNKKKEVDTSVNTMPIKEEAEVLVEVEVRIDEEEKEVKVKKKVKKDRYENEG